MQSLFTFSLKIDKQLGSLGDLVAQFSSYLELIAPESCNEGPVERCRTSIEESPECTRLLNAKKHLNYTMMASFAGFDNRRGFVLVVLDTRSSASEPRVQLPGDFCSKLEEKLYYHLVPVAASMNHEREEPANIVTGEAGPVNFTFPV